MKRRGGAVFQQMMGKFHAGDVVGSAVAGHASVENVEGVSAFFFNVVLHGGEADVPEPGDGKVVEAAHAVVFRDFQALLLKRVEHAVGHKIVDGDNAGNAVVALQAFHGEFVARAVFDAYVVQFFERRDFPCEKLYRGVRFLGIDGANAVEPAHAYGVGVVERGGNEGNVPVSEAEHMTAHKHAGAVIVEFHRVHVEAGVPVSYDHHGNAAVDLFHNVHALGHHGEDQAGYAHFQCHVEDFLFLVGISVGGEDERGGPVLFGRLLYGLNHVGIVGVAHVGTDDEYELSCGQRPASAAYRGAVSQDFCRMSDVLHGIGREGYVGASAEYHGGGAQRHTGLSAHIFQGDFFLRRHGRFSTSFNARLPTRSNRLIATIFSFPDTTSASLTHVSLSPPT